MFLSFRNSDITRTSRSGQVLKLKNFKNKLFKFSRSRKNGNWSYIYAVGSQEYQVVYTRLDIASADVGSLKANLQHMEALSTTEAGYMTFTKAWKKEIWLKGLLIESGYELRLVAGIAIGALVKDCSRSEVPAQVKVVAYRY
ncbi:hypothetical protein Tco_1033049 [Tanacetum coccineum]|uniref:Uncharacterized protein n=1 Tax=Tanacetum coccineum TaxID=301880 RepID=A0ABQ5GG03_9ASTR